MTLPTEPQSPHDWLLPSKVCYKKKTSKSFDIQFFINIFFMYILTFLGVFGDLANFELSYFISCAHPFNAV